MTRADAYRSKLANGFIQRLDTLVTLIVGGGLPSRDAASLLVARVVAELARTMSHDDAAAMVADMAGEWATDFKAVAEPEAA